MIYNQHDWDENGMPVLDQDLQTGYDELEDGDVLSPAEERMLWGLVILGLLALGAVAFVCVAYDSTK